MVTFDPGEGVDEALLNYNEHWLVVGGTIDLTVDGLEIELAGKDLALLKAGAVRKIRSTEGARVVLACE